MTKPTELHETNCLGPSCWQLLSDALFALAGHLLGAAATLFPWPIRPAPSRRDRPGNKRTSSPSYTVRESQGSGEVGRPAPNGEHVARAVRARQRLAVKRSPSYN